MKSKYIINPATGRKVLKNGIIGKKLIQNGGGLGFSKIGVSPPLTPPSTPPKNIGKGSFGIVYRPALRCRNESRKNPLDTKNINRNNYVSKVFFDKTSRDEEGKELQKVSQMNPISKFHIKKEYDCRVRNNIKYSIPKRDLFDRKFIKEYSTKDKYASIFKYGGETLYDINPRKINKELISKLYTLFEGVYIMGEHGLLHFDIKGDNTLYHHKHGFKFIDFGYLFKPFMNDKIDKDRQERIENNYFIWPWDIKLYKFQDLAKKLTLEYIDKNPEHYDQYIQIINWDAISYKNKNDALNHYQYHKKPEFIDSFYNRMRDLIKKEGYREQLMKTVDVYSLGVTLKNILLTNSYLKKIGKERGDLDLLLIDMISDDTFRRPLPKDALKRFVDAMKSDFGINLSEKYNKTINPRRKTTSPNNNELQNIEQELSNLVVIPSPLQNQRYFTPRTPRTPNSPNQRYFTPRIPNSPNQKL